MNDTFAAAGASPQNRRNYGGDPVKYGVVVPVYRGRPFIERALAGVFSQEGAEALEVVVIEDGTPDGATVEDLVSPYPAIYVRLPVNQGVFRARWQGLQHLTPSVDFCAFLDQDDVWHPAFLQRMGRLLAQDPACGFAACNMRVVTGNASHPLYSSRHPSLTLTDLKVANQLVSPSQVLMRTAALRALDIPPDLPYPGADDWWLWLATPPPILLPSWPTIMTTPEGRTTIGRQCGVSHWFSRWHFSRWDERLYAGRIGWDALATGVRRRQWSLVCQGLGRVLKDPRAVCAAGRFRRRHKRQGVV